MATKRKPPQPPTRNNTGLLSVNLSGYEPRPAIEDTKGGEYVKYGTDNLYPQYLVDLYNSSPTHRALVTTIALRVYGDGLQPSDLDSLLLYEKWNLEDELRKVTVDLKLHFAFALEINWSLDRSTIANVSHLPVENVRSGLMDENEEVQEYFYSSDWANRGIEPQRYARFNPDTKNEHPVQLLYVKPFSPGSYYYAKPDYIGAIEYIELEKEIGIFHINNIKNGLAPSFAIHFANGAPGEEEQRAIKNRISRELTGTGNAGKFIATFSDDPTRKPTFEPFPLSDADKQYQFLSTEAQDKIMIGHRVVSPAMFGVKTAGQLGNVQELEQAAELFDQQVTKPFRRIVIDALNPVYEQAGTKAKYNLSTDRVPVELCELLQGEDEEELLADYELIDTRKVDYDQEAALDNLWTFARTIDQQGPQTSEQDTELIKVRYAYAPTIARDENNRDFCKVMLDANKVYRKEDIVAAGRQAVNPGWGPRGANTYDIWLYKGGGSCRHFWERRTYLKKTNARISVADAKKIIQNAGVDAKRLEVNDPKVAKRPRDMENRGFLDPRNFTTPR